MTRRISLQIFAFITSISFLLIQSCSFSAKENYLKEFSAFVSDVENSYNTFSSDDWKVKDSEFKEFTESGLKKHHKALTEEDKKTIGQLVARYSVVRAKGYGKQLKDGFDDTINYINGFLEGLTEEANENDINKIH